MEVKNLSSSSAGYPGRRQPTAVLRMKQDYMRLKQDPLPYITAEPLPNNILEWHYVVKGPEDTPYYGGYYHGTLVFPREFPFKPPSIYMITPNGRFKTNTRLCLSISDFHPDTWNPTWCVGSILTGLLSFMLETTVTMGSIETTIYEKKKLAKMSLAFNLKNPQFVELFPEICQEINHRLIVERNQIEQAQINQTTHSNIPKGTINSTNRQSKRHRLLNDIYNEDIRIGSRVENIQDTTPITNFCINWQSNLIMGVCVILFALIVHYVLKNINQE